MKKLIAARPIQYMGQTYDQGDAVPAYEQRMVDAWLEAGSAEWSDDAAEQAAQAAAPADANTLAADALRAMGVKITDDTGTFVGAAALTEQIKALAAPAEPAKDAQTGAEVKEPAQVEKNAQAGAQAAGTSEMVTGHLDAKQLERMTKAELTDLAEKLGVDISEAKNNTERANLIAAVEVQAPADENGGAQ